MRKLLPLSALLILLVSCNLSLMTGGVVSGGKDVIVKPEEVFSGLAPSGVMASQSHYTDRIVIAWNTVKGADYYQLERAEFDVKPTQEMASRASWEALSESATGTSFTDDDNSLEEGKYYAYRIWAIGNNGLEGERSAVCYGSLLAPPSVIDASKGEDSARITITWNQMPGVQSYSIYTSNDSTTVQIGERIATVSQLEAGSGEDENGKANSFSYTVPQDDYGKTLYFAVVSNGPASGSTSAVSPVSSGYTRVAGAASTPTMTSVTKGDSTDGITLMWAPDSYASDDDPVNYTITRSFPGSNEITVFPSYSGQEPQVDASGNYYFVDSSDIRENVVYTYSIVASNSIGMSPANIQSAYILSPPQSLSFTADAETKSYKLETILPVGAEDEGNDWSYEVTRTFQDGSQSVETISLAELMSLTESFSAADKNDAAYQNEVRSISVRTVNGDLASESAATASIQGIPDTPVIEASENRKSSQSANANGVFPVEISLSLPSSSYTAYDYVITRGDGHSFTSTSSTAYDSEEMEVGKVYSYTAVARDALGRSSASSDSSDGYGAITGEAFIQVFEDHLLKPWEAPSLHPDYVSGSKSSIWGYISQAGTGSLGSATVTGSALRGLPDSDIAGQSGRISYNAVVAGLGGSVTFAYTKYYSEATSFDRDFYMASDSSYNMNVSMSGSGSVSGGPIATGGMYPASVDFGGLSVQNNAFIGRYRVTMDMDGGKADYEVVAK